MSDESDLMPESREKKPVDFADELLDGVPGDYKHCCKVGRMADKYDLTSAVIDGDINRELLAKWRGINEYPEWSVRALVSWLNRKIMRKIYLEHDREDTATKLDVEYEALIGDDEDRRWWIEDELEQDGIDPESLRNDFLSTATLYRHLTNCLGAEKGNNSDSDSNWEQENIEFAREQFADKIRDTLKSWDNKDVLPGGADAEVSVAVDLACPVCSTSVPIRQARQRGYICEDHLGSRADPDEDLKQEDDANF